MRRRLQTRTKALAIPTPSFMPVQVGRLSRYQNFNPMLYLSTRITESRKIVLRMLKLMIDKVGGLHMPKSFNLCCVVTLFNQKGWEMTNVRRIQ